MPSQISCDATVCRMAEAVLLVAWCRKRGAVRGVTHDYVVAAKAFSRNLIAGWIMVALLVAPCLPRFVARQFFGM